MTCNRIHYYYYCLLICAPVQQHCLYFPGIVEGLILEAVFAGFIILLVKVIPSARPLNLLTLTSECKFVLANCGYTILTNAMTLNTFTFWNCQVATEMALR